MYFYLNLNWEYRIFILQWCILQNNESQQRKTSTLLRHLSSNGIDCYQNILQILKNDYPVVAKKLEHELLKERTSLSKDINDSLIEIINKQLLPIVHGTGTGSVKSDCLSQNQSSYSSLARLSDLINQLQTKCLNILNVPSNKARHVALPVLISRKIKEQQEIVKRLKSDINDIKLLPKKKKSFYVQEELSPSAQIYQLRKDLQQQHERVRQLQQSLLTKESIVSEFKTENELIQNQIRELKRQATNEKLQITTLFDDTE